jgi:hypothetical protein
MNRKVWGTRLILRPYPQNCGFCISSHCKLDHKDTARRSYRSVHVFTKPITEPWFQKVHLAAAYEDTWRNVLLLRNVAWNSFPVASACNLLNHIYILTANLKFPPCQHTNTSYTIKIAVIHLKFQNFNTNQMSTNISLSMHYICPCLNFDVSSHHRYLGIKRHHKI